MTMKGGLSDAKVIIIKQNRQEFMNSLPWMIQLDFESAGYFEKIIFFLVLLAHFGQVSEKQG